MTFGLLLLLAVGRPHFVVHSRAAPVRALVADGPRLWAATPGGLIEAEAGRVRRHTTLDGLQSNDQRRVVMLGGRPIAVGRFAVSGWDGERWRAMEPRAPIIDAAADDQRLVALTPDRLLIWRAGEERAAETPLDALPARADRPESAAPDRPLAVALGSGRLYLLTEEALWVEGTDWRRHRAPAPKPVVEMLAAAGGLVVATPGDLFRWDGGGWRALRLALPPQALQVAGAAVDGDGLLLGLFGLGLARLHASGALTLLEYCPDITAVAPGPRYGTRAGAIAGQGGSVEPLPGPPDNYLTSLARWRGRLWVATLENGVAGFDGEDWEALEGIASPWVRQLAVYGDRLWLRHADGRLESYDGRQPRLVSVGPGLPRAWFSALAATPTALYAGVYGGLARFDGRAWTTWLHQSPLADQVITALAPWVEGLAVGTQGRGLVIGDPARGDWRSYDERHGLGEPWVTALAAGKGLRIGTFNRGGGLLPPGAERLEPLPGLPAEVGVAALSAHFAGGRDGLFAADGRWAWPLPDLGVTCLLEEDDTLWVGTRAGLLEARGWPEGFNEPRPTP